MYLFSDSEKCQGLVCGSAICSHFNDHACCFKTSHFLILFYKSYLTQLLHVEKGGKLYLPYSKFNSLEDTDVSSTLYLTWFSV